MNNKTYLLLDDIRTPMAVARYVRHSMYVLEQWTVVKNYQEFTEHITKNGLPFFISFDHDLADEHYAPEDKWNTYDQWASEQNFQEKTGYDCAKWLVEYCLDNNLDCPQFFCHSMNPVGRDRINSLLMSFPNKQK